MNKIKKAGIITGAVVGGAVEEPYPCRQMTNQKFIDELGKASSIQLF